MIKLSAYFTGFGSRADGSAGLRFSTQELSPEDFSELKKSLNQFGWIVFKENDINESDIPDTNAEEEGISASERLRRVLFVYYKQKKIKEDFEVWRRRQMETIIEKFKEKLE